MVGEPVVTDEGREQGIEVGESLGAGRFPLQGVEEIDGLAERGAEMLGRGALDLAVGAAETFEEQVLEIPATAVNRQHAEIMDVEISLAMSIGDVVRVDLVQPVVAGDVGRDVVVQTLQGVAHVGVLVDPPILLGEVGIHRFDRFLDKGSGFTQRGMLLTVEDVGLGGLGMAILDEDLFDQVLDVLDGRYATVLVNDLEDSYDLATDPGDLFHVGTANGLDRLLNGRNDLFFFKCYKSPIPFANEFQHRALPQNKKYPKKLSQANKMGKRKTLYVDNFFYETHNMLCTKPWTACGRNLLGTR